MTTNTPTIITIKLLAATAPSVKDVQAALTSFGTVLQYEAANLVFDGNALVPVASSPAAVAAPVAAPKAPAKAAPKAPRKAAEPKEAKEAKDGKIQFEPGSGPDKVWQTIRCNMAMTSTELREKTGLNSNIVNTTIYRLKKAGMIRAMNRNDGDTKYTSTEFDEPRAASDESTF